MIFKQFKHVLKKVFMLIRALGIFYVVFLIAENKFFNPQPDEFFNPPLVLKAFLVIALLLMILVGVTCLESLWSEKNNITLHILEFCFRPKLVKYFFAPFLIIMGLFFLVHSMFVLDEKTSMIARSILSLIFVIAGMWIYFSKYFPKK